MRQRKKKIPYLQAIFQLVAAVATTAALTGCAGVSPRGALDLGVGPVSVSVGAASAADLPSPEDLVPGASRPTKNGISLTYTHANGAPGQVVTTCAVTPKGGYVTTIEIFSCLQGQSNPILKVIGKGQVQPGKSCKQACAYLVTPDGQERDFEFKSKGWRFVSDLTDQALEKYGQQKQANAQAGYHVAMARAAAFRKG